MILPGSETAFRVSGIDKLNKKKRLGSISNLPENILYTTMRSPLGDAGVRSADPADVIVPLIAVGGNP